MATIDGPLADDTITYTYDELGRVFQRTINGSANLLELTYDILGRLATEVNALGTFTYTYHSTTSRLASVLYPNGQLSSYAYFPLPQDERLQTIHHQTPSGVTLSRFDYTYDVLGNVLTWRQQVDADPAVEWTYGYDRSDQLIHATKRSTAPPHATLGRHAYVYDVAGNRVAEQIDDSVTGSTYDDDNKLVHQSSGGTLRFVGLLSEPAVVTIDGREAVVDATQGFVGNATVAQGTTTVGIAAVDASGNAGTARFEVDQTGSTKTLTFDANGNMLSDGTRSLEWDAANRLVAVVVGSERLELAHDGLHRLRRIVKRVNGTVVHETRLVVCGRRVCEERDVVPSSAVRRYFRRGWIDQTAHFVVMDHLDNTRDVTGPSGGRESRYDYDPFGRLAATGAVNATFTFTGFRTIGSLAMAQYRAYDANHGRWTSPDPMGFVDGPNVYAYARNNPVTNVDPSGLFTVDKTCKNRCVPMNSGGPANPDKQPTQESLESVINTSGDQACKDKVGQIQDAKLRKCVEDSCRGGRVRCGKCETPEGAGENRVGGRWRKYRTVTLCVDRWPDWMTGDDVGATMIHEWAHGCGWNHEDEGGVP